MRKYMKMIAMILSVVLVMGMLPSASYAETTNPFGDVKEGDWFYESVQYVYEHGMMSGTGEGEFSPNETTTRGMIVVILHRLEGTPEVEGEEFADVPDGQWYSKAVDWASANNIVTGYGNGKFGPQDYITREQMVTILYRYAKYKEYDVTARISLDKYTDAKQLGVFAIDAMKWANALNLVNGTSNITLSPQGNATRGQVAAIMMRFCKNMLQNADAVLNYFTADETYFLANEEHTITFTVETNGNVGESIYICDDEGNRIGEMHDDGLDGDDVAEDGVYSFEMTANVPVGTKTYHASTQDVNSNKISIYYLELPTEESRQQDQKVEENIQKMEEAYVNEDGYVPQSEADKVLAEVEAYAKQLLADGEILFYEMSDNGMMIKMASGLSIHYAPAIEGIDSIGYNTSMNVVTYQPCESMYDSVLHSYLDLVDESAEDTDTALDNYTFSGDYDNRAVSLEQIKELGANEVILWHGHGDYTASYHSMLLTGEEFDWDAWMWDIGYWWDCVQDRIVDGGRAMITSKYISKYCNNMNNSFVYLAACSSGRDSTLANAFLNKGADAVVGNSQTIYTVYNLLMMNEVVHNLTQVNAATKDYYTLSEAMAAAKNTHGDNDLAWYTGSNPKSDSATPRIFGDTDANLYQLASTKDINFYYVFDSMVSSWSEAKQNCEKLGGHLATLNSREENSYVFQLMKEEGYQSAYFGLTDSAAEGIWKWVTGETVSYTNWHSGEPNRENTNEDYAMFYYKFTDGTWNDGDFGGKTVNSGRTYICEWDTWAAYKAFRDSQPQ